MYGREIFLMLYEMISLEIIFWRLNYYKKTYLWSGGCTWRAMCLGEWLYERIYAMWTRYWQ